MLPLVELTRRNLVECRHHGALALARADGTAFSYGDAAQAIFPRSAIKALQAVPIVTSGAADAFSLTDRELALCCASHSGAPAHVETVQAIFAKAGLAEEALVCGAHLPLGDAFAHALLRANGHPCRYHNNCSGKHAGMLTTAVHMGEPTAGYHEVAHPVQQRIRAVLGDVVGVELGDEAWGVDGCSVPNWALPLDKLALAFARFVSGSGLSSGLADAAARITQAIWQHPDMVAGPGRLDTILMERFKGDVFIKGGAEGVCCGGIRSLGIGFALKIEDGAKRGTDAVVEAVIGHLLDEGRDLIGPTPLRNVAGTVVGETRLDERFATALADFAAQSRG